MRYIVIIFALLFLSGCIKEVQPWEKASLAKDAMQEGGSNKLVTKFHEHIYYSKEATKGGGTIGGGGCGCN